MVKAKMFYNIGPRKANLYFGSNQRNKIDNRWRWLEARVGAMQIGFETWVYYIILGVIG